MSVAPPLSTLPPPSLAALFLCFAEVSVKSFGGGTTPWIWREVVERRRWIDEERFIGGVALSQIVPGANAVNLTIFVGTVLRGWTGAVCAFAGLIAMPAIVVLSIGMLYVGARQIPLVQYALGGLGAAAIGMNLALGV